MTNAKQREGPAETTTRVRAEVGTSVGFVGLGRMGFNMVTRLARQGHDVTATTRDQVKVAR